MPYLWEQRAVQPRHRGACRRRKPAYRSAAALLQLNARWAVCMSSKEGLSLHLMDRRAAARSDERASACKLLYLLDVEQLCDCGAQASLAPIPSRQRRWRHDGPGMHRACVTAQLVVQPSAGCIVSWVRLEAAGEMGIGAGVKTKYACSAQRSKEWGDGTGRTVQGRQISSKSQAGL